MTFCPNRVETIINFSIHKKTTSVYVFTNVYVCVYVNSTSFAIAGKRPFSLFVCDIEKQSQGHAITATTATTATIADTQRQRQRRLRRQQQQ